MTVTNPYLLALSLFAFLFAGSFCGMLNNGPAWCVIPAGIFAIAALSVTPFAIRRSESVMRERNWRDKAWPQIGSFVVDSANACGKPVSIYIPQNAEAVEVTYGSIEYDVLTMFRKRLNDTFIVFEENHLGLIHTFKVSKWKQTPPPNY
jgi:hypothetical protein